MPDQPLQSIHVHYPSVSELAERCRINADHATASEKLRLLALARSYDKEARLIKASLGKIEDSKSLIDTANRLLLRSKSHFA